MCGCKIGRVNGAARINKGDAVKVELSRFKVKKGKADRVDEWMELLNNNMGELIQSLDREKMQIEVIFREIISGEEYLYWFSVQGDSGEMADTSPFELDKRHLAFHDECVDHSYGMRDAQAQVIMVPEKVAKAMAWDSPSEDKVAFTGKEVVFKKPKNEMNR